MKEHSKNFDKIKKWYIMKLWDEKRVRNAVNLWITKEEYTEITEQAY